MKQKFIKLNDHSYVEVATRIFDGKENVMLALRGQANSAEPAIASVILDDHEVRKLIEVLSEVILKESDDI